jgi:uncharacterized protein (TIGR02246 family)
MPNLRFLYLLLIVAGLCLPGCTQQAQRPEQSSGPEQDPDVLRSREQQRVAYLVAGDFDRLAEMISPTLTYTHSNAAVESKEQFLSSLRGGQVVYRSLNHRDVEVRFVRPDVAILNGLSDVVVAVAGEEQTVPLRFTIVYVEQQGEWLFEAWHSVRRPPV